MNYYVLEVKFSFNRKEDCIFPVILKNDKETILVDCGYQGFLPLIEHAAQLYNISFQDLTGVIITHHDMDHMGGLYELKEKYPFVKVYTSPLEKAFVCGDKKSLRLIQAEDLFHCIPDDQRQGALEFQEMLKQVRPVPVNDTISEEKIPNVLDGIKVVHTPGHTPGHFSLYLKDSKTLIAADAFVYERGEFDIANPGFTLDLPEAINSIKKILHLDIDEVVCYHGGLVQGDIKSKLRNLLRKYGFQ